MMDFADTKMKNENWSSCGMQRSITLLICIKRYSGTEGQ